MKEDKSRDFWIIFDTCTVKQYYHDVHKLLAIPNGWIIRYSYREDWLTPRAILNAEKYPNCTDDVLLLYSQYKGYQRGEEHESYRGKAERIWVPTRFAKLADCEISEGRRGREFYFDLEVQNYPGIDEGSLVTLMKDLEEKEEAPFDKWVAISGRGDCLQALKEGSGCTESWKQVVDRFGALDCQFSGDVFWRLKAVRSKERNDIISCSYGAAYDKTVGRRPYSYFQIGDGENLCFDLEYRFGINSNGNSLHEDGRAIEIDDNSSPLEIHSSKRIELRPYYEESLDAHVVGAKNSEGNLSFKTVPRRDNWPTGAEMDFRFKVGEITKSEEDTEFALILRGGGVKGVALAGAVKELERYLKFKTYVGTSAGAIVGALLASGFSGNDVVEILKDLDFNTFMSEGKVKSVINFLHGYAESPSELS